ncbi:MAG: serine/threonine-protein kinase [Granulosicoccus sp.]
MSFPEIPGYTILSQLGEGGFATVYLAIQEKLDREVALKVMNPSLSQDAEFCVRFLREGKDAANLSNHPHIVTTYDIGQEGSLYYIAMQYLPGPTLKDLLDSKEPHKHPVDIVIRIADALAYLHEKGYVHRDIKPANILFNEANEAVLADFGIAKAKDRHTQLTIAGAIVGTAKYMSPEQAKAEAQVDGRSDLYSLGVVFYELLTRQPPFMAADPMVLMLQHIQSDAPRLPPEKAVYQPIIDKLLAKDPKKRFATGHELIDKLEQTFLFNQEAFSEQNLNRTESKDHYKSGKIAVYGFTALALAIGAALFAYSYYFTGAPSKECKSLDGESADRLQRLLETADIHEQVGRITQPPGANAVEAYSLALEVDPCNEVAISALKRLSN